MSWCELCCITHPGASEILGLEVAGIVHEVSEGVTKYKKGDKVMALLDGGGYAQYAAAPEGFVMPMPKNLSFAEAAGIPEVSRCYHPPLTSVLLSCSLLLYMFWHVLA